VFLNVTSIAKLCQWYKCVHWGDFFLTGCLRFFGWRKIKIRIRRLSLDVHFFWKGNNFIQVLSLFYRTTSLVIKKLKVRAAMLFGNLPWYTRYWLLSWLLPSRPRHSVICGQRLNGSFITSKFMNPWNRQIPDLTNIWLVLSLTTTIWFKLFPERTVSSKHMAPILIASGLYKNRQLL